MLAKTFCSLDNPLTVTVCGGLIVAVICFVCLTFFGKPALKYFNTKRLLKRINTTTYQNRLELNEIVVSCKNAKNIKPDNDGFFTFTFDNSVLRNIETFGVTNKELAVLLKKADLLAHENVTTNLEELSSLIKEILTINQKDLFDKVPYRINDKIKYIETTIKEIEKCQFGVIFQYGYSWTSNENTIETISYKKNKEAIEYIESMIKNCSIMIE